ncbi:MAG TPA: hypothetical protein VFQ53_21000 [Kofleriaceae bacterium]|nr:hypothetical protein [Kofleriaceae bacterium]
MGQDTNDKPGGLFGRPESTPREPWQQWLDDHLLGPEPAKRPPAAPATPPSPAQVDQISRSIHAPSKIDLGTTEVGDRSVSRTLVYADGQGHGHQGPRIAPTVDGIPGLRLKHAPMTLFASETTYNPHEHDIELEYQPYKPGPVHGTLDLHVSDPRYANRTIAIEGKAHQTPSPTLAPIPTFFDLGEQVIGSEHTFTVATLKKLSGNMPAQFDLDLRNADVAAGVPQPLRVDAMNGLSVEPGPHRFSSDEAAVRVRFAPARSGAYRANLFVAVAWHNGEFVHHQIVLTASARDVHDAPAQVQDKPARPQPDMTDAKHVQPTPTDVATFDIEGDAAGEAARHLAGRQRAAVGAVQTEITNAKAPAPRSSIFEELAGLAITMAVGGLAQVVSKAIAAKLVAAKQDPVVFDGLASAIKDGLKAKAKAVSLPKGAANAGHHESGSGDPFAEFFGRQELMLTDLESQNEKLIIAERRRLLPLLASRPQVVFDGLRQLKQAFEESSQDAYDLQATSTAARWASALAQQRLGADVVHRGDKLIGPATRMSPENSVDRSGVLQLYARMDGAGFDTSRMLVERAELHGVPDTTCERFVKDPIDKLGLPVRIVLQSRSGVAFITRDEVGRVQLEGTLPPAEFEDNGKPAAIQRHHDAELVCRALLATSLVERRIPLVSDIRGNRDLDKKGGSR